MMRRVVDIEITPNPNALKFNLDGVPAANALQRGLWTHTKNGLPYFDSITNGWIDYSHNLVLVRLFSHALVSSATGHTAALELVKEDF